MTEPDIAADRLTPGGRTFAACIDAAKATERAADWSAARLAYEDALTVLPAGAAAARAAAELFRWIGHIWRNLGEVDLCIEAYDASLEIGTRAGLTGEVAGTLNALGIIDQFRGRVDAARERYAHARTLAVAAADHRLAALIDQNLGTLADMTGDSVAAVKAFTTAQRRFELLSDTTATIRTLNNLGISYSNLERWAEAEESLNEAFRLADLERDPELLGAVEVNRAHLFIRTGALSAARECCDRAFELFSRNGSQLRLGETLKSYGMLFREMNRPGLSDEHFSRAAAIASTCEYRLLEAEICSEWAKLHLREERNREALRMLNRARRIFENLHARREFIDLDRRLDGLEETYLSVVQRWAESIESADRYTAGHCERVAELTCRIAALAGFAGRDLVWIRMGGYLHDVGKINVPAEVLNKPGKLDAVEWEFIKRHTTDGDAIVAELKFPWEIGPMVRSHHERMDGLGYPDGLAGPDIPLTARILGVADVFDALTTARSYRPALTAEEALRIMTRDVGTAFDPEIFALFRQVVAPGAAPPPVDTTVPALPPRSRATPSRSRDGNSAAA